MREEGIDFHPRSNAFMGCGRSERLRELADALTPRDLTACGQKWLACFRSSAWTSPTRSIAATTATVSSSSTCATTSSCAPRPRPTTSPTTASTKPSKTSPPCAEVLDALGPGADRYTLASLRYDLSKLRAKGLIEKLPHSRCYRLLPNGYSICLVFLKLSERIYAPLIAGLLSPARAGGKLHCQSRSQPREVAMALPPSRETPVWFISGCSCGFGRQLAKSSSIAATASPRQRAIRSSSPTSPRSRGRAGAEARRQ